MGQFLNALILFQSFEVTLELGSIQMRQNKVNLFVGCVVVGQRLQLEVGEVGDGRRIPAEADPLRIELFRIFGGSGDGQTSAPGFPDVEPDAGGTSGDAAVDGRRVQRLGRLVAEDGVAAVVGQSGEVQLRHLSLKSNGLGFYNFF